LFEVGLEQMDLARGNVIIVHVNRNAVQFSDTTLSIAKALSRIKECQALDWLSERNSSKTTYVGLSGGVFGRSKAISKREVNGSNGVRVCYSGWNIEYARQGAAIWNDNRPTVDFDRIRLRDSCDGRNRKSNCEHDLHKRLPGVTDAPEGHAQFRGQVPKWNCRRCIIIVTVRGGIDNRVQDIGNSFD
jgi:hypothetical protein